MALIPLFCGKCGMDEGLVLVHRIVGQIVIGAREDCTIVGDGGPEVHDPAESVPGQHVWCSTCCAMIDPCLRE